MHKIQNIDKKFPAFSRDCWIILCFKLLNSGEARLLGLDFVDKNDNIEGLQIADFVPNCFARDHAGIKQCKPNIFGTLKYHRYDGGTGQADRFGVKYMP